MATRILDAEARITARDLTGGAFEGVANKIARVNRAAQSLARDLDRHMAASGRAGFIDRLSTRLDNFGDTANKFGRRMTYGVTLPAALAARSVFHNVHDFELASNKLKAFGDLNEDELKRARALAQSIGSKYSFGPTGVLQGMVEEVKAGFEPRHLAAIQQPLLDFATLAEIDVPKAAELAIFSLSGFGKMYDATGKMLDDSAINKNLREMIDLFAILNKVAPGSIGQISETFKYSAAAASKLGVSPEQLGAFTAVLNQAGIIGPEAGVALRSMMVRFLKPTRPALAALNAVGMKLDDYIQIDPSRLKPEAILSAVENYTGTIGTGKNKQKFGVGKAPDAKREEFLREIGKLNGLQGEDYVKGLTGVLRNTVGGGMQDAKVAGDLAQRIVGTAVEKIDVMKFLKDVSAKAPNMAAFMANFMDQRQAVRLANLDQARVTTMLVAMEKELTAARERGTSVSRDQAGTINSGLIEAENKLRGSYQNMIQSVAQSGVTDAAITAMDGVAKGLKAIGDTNPKILEWSTYAIGAAAAIGPLAFVLGNLAKGGAAVAGAFSWLLPAGTGAAAAAAARTPAGAALLAGVPAYLAYSDVSGQAGRMGDYQSRMMRGGFIPSDRDFAPDKFERLTVESIQAAVRGDRSIEGRVQVDVTTKVEPSPDFISRAISSVKSLWSGGITGTTGSTGTSMPEAMPGGVP